MRFWRICRLIFAPEAATGEGSRRFGGRWNSRGVRIVYTSTSLALAAVETFVNLEPNLRPSDLVSIDGRIPDELVVARVDVKALEAHWQEKGDESLRRFGDEWIREAKTAVLLVPSAAIHGDWNILMNPTHPEFGRIEFRPPQPFAFDVRMFR